ncbi:MAG: nucleotidyltransferase domain-containing protein [Chitinophagales bacterium]
MQQLINEKLRHIAQEQGINILYACESGSRAWGFASPDSDYDVRFIYAYPADRYLAITPPKDQITLPIDENLLDVVGWDIRKALGLMRKSNASLLSWLKSPIVYANPDGFLAQIKALESEYFAPKAVLYHYLGLTKQIYKNHIEGKTVVNVKKYFYVLRPLLCARWVVERKTAPPMLFNDLLPLIAHENTLLAEIDALLLVKKQVKEGQTVDAVPNINAFAVAEMERLKTLAITLPKKQGDETALNQLFKQVILG